MVKNGKFKFIKKSTSNARNNSPKAKHSSYKDKGKEFHTHFVEINARNSYDANLTSMKDDTSVVNERSEYRRVNTSNPCYYYNATQSNEKIRNENSMPLFERKVSKISNGFPKKTNESETTHLLSQSKKSILKFMNKDKDTENAQLRDMKTEVNINDHFLPLTELFKLHETHPEKGLTEQEVAKRLDRDGPNALPEKTEINNMYLLVGYIFRGFSALLWFGATLSFVAYFIESQTNAEKPKDNIWLGVILAVTCVVTGVFSYYQDKKSSRIMDTFNKLIPTRATVVRDSCVKEIDAAELVQGDIVLLKMGDKVPADIRLLENQDMKIENSSLTGEVEPVSCTLEATNSFALESRNVVFFSTNIVCGYGKGVVILTGSRTVMGKIARLTNDLEKKKTPIEQEVQHFMHLISIWAITLGTICFLLALCVGYNWLNACVYVIGIIVANVPEGLLATLTVSLTLTAKRLASKNCIVKRLEAVETLGSIRTICSDKTGTLTQNKMKVVHLSFNREVQDVGNGVEMDVQNAERNSTYKTLIRAACLCSKAEYEPNQQVSGDATECGILHFVQPIVKCVDDVRNTFPKVAELPFNSLNKFNITIHFSPLNKYFILIKGAAEVVLEKCTTMMADCDRELFLTHEIRYELEEHIRLFASQGERVLAFADLHLTQNEFPINYKFSTNPLNFPTHGFRFIGLISLFDPPRLEVPAAIDACRKAGIRVIMVTGDHPLTAEAIAKRINILTKHPPDDSCVVSGTTLRKMTDIELKELLRTNEELVFARTSPQQKLRIVETCQSLDEIVAVTGDGVNDAPALKKADIGIAMGITGSEVSKQTADMILMDDNFSTIVLGIEEGRLIFDNLKKSIAYVLASNVPEILPFLFYIFLGIPLPVSTVTVLCIDLGTDMWPAVSLAYEKSESDIMQRKPRNIKTDRLVSRKLVTYAYFHIGILETIAGFLTYFHVMFDSGWKPYDLLNIRKQWESDEILTDSYGQQWNHLQRVDLECTCQTAYFIAIVVAQCAGLIVFKTRHNSIFHQKMNNWVLNVGLLFELIIAFLVTYSPLLNKALKTRPVLPKYWATPLPLAVLMVVYSEISKLVNKKTRRIT